MSYYLRKIFSIASPTAHSGSLYNGGHESPKKPSSKQLRSPTHASLSPSIAVSPVTSPTSPHCLKSLSTVTVCGDITSDAPPKTPKIPCKELDVDDWEKADFFVEDEKCSSLTEDRGSPWNPGVKIKPAPISESRNSSVSSFSSNASWSTWTSNNSQPIAPTTFPKPKSKCRVSFANPMKPQPTYMHPLFAWTRSRPTAPIYYDVSLPPTTVHVNDHGSPSMTTTVTDFLNQRIPLCTLLEPATEPPTRGSLTLKCDNHPWSIVVTGSGVRNGGGTQVHSAKTVVGRPERRKKGRTFYIESSDSDDEHEALDKDPEYAVPSGPNAAPIITNLDVLRAIHDQLMRPITQEEWAALGGGESNEQRRIARAYRKRCQQTHVEGGDSVWGEGVKRIDYLQGRCMLVGIEASEGGGGWNDGVKGQSELGFTGRLILSDAR